MSNVSITYIVRNYNGDFGKIDSQGEIVLTSDESEKVKAEIARIERLFVTDSINGNGQWAIEFQVYFYGSDEGDLFTRYYADRKHFETV